MPRSRGARPWLVHRDFGFARRSRDQCARLRADPAPGAGPTSLILNPFLETTFGQNEEGTAFLYGWQLTHEVRKGFLIGVEGFGRYADIGGSGGDIRHRIGPLVTFEFETGEKRTLTFEAGVLFGLT